MRPKAACKLVHFFPFIFVAGATSLIAPTDGRRFLIGIPSLLLPPDITGGGVNQMIRYPMTDDWLVSNYTCTEGNGAQRTLTDEQYCTCQ